MTAAPTFRRLRLSPVPRRSKIRVLLAACGIATLLISACGGAAAPTSAPPTSSAPAASTASPKASAGASAASKPASSAAAASSASAAGSPAQASQIDVQAVKSEGKVVGYGVLVDSQWKALDDLMKKRYGIPVENFRSNTAPIVSRVETEEGAGNHSYDFIVLESVWQTQLAAKGYYQKLPTELINRVPEKWRDPKGYWATFTLFPVTIIYNTDIVKGADVPKTVDDLLNPKWKGKLAMTDPALDDTVLRWMEQIREQKGDKANDFFTKLAAQNPTFFQSGLTVSTNINQGQFAMGIGFMTHTLSVGGPNGHMAYMPMDPMYNINGAFAMATKPAHPAAQKALADLFLSKEYLQQSGDLGYPITVPGVKSAIPGADSLNYKDLAFPPPDKAKEVSDYFKGIFKK